MKKTMHARLVEALETCRASSCLNLSGPAEQPAPLVSRASTGGAFAALAFMFSLAFLLSCNQDETAFGPQDVAAFQSTVTGRVTDRQGRALSGALVTALPSGATTVSGPDGSFTLSGLASGSYRIALAKDDYRDTVWMDSVRLGLSIKSDIGAQGMRFRYATIKGVVEDSSGKAMDPTTSAAIAVEDQTAFAPMVSDGRFTLGRVEPGRVRLFTAIQGVGYGTLDTILSPDDTLKGVRLRIRGKGGTVTGKIVDSDSKPVSGATVTAVGGALKTTTGQDGAFRITEVPGTGKVVVMVVKGDLSAVVSGVRVGEGSKTDLAKIRIGEAAAGGSAVSIRPGLAIALSSDSVVTLVADTMGRDSSYRPIRHLWSLDGGNTWDTTSVNTIVLNLLRLGWNGSNHVVFVKAVMVDGSTTTAGTIEVRVLPPPDWTAPAATRLGPASGSIFAWKDSTQTLVWRVKDDRKLDSVWIGGKFVPKGDSDRCSLRQILSVGRHAYTLVARDSAGNTTRDSLILERRVFDTTTPSIARVSPMKDTTYRYADTSALVTWKVTDAGGLDSVWLDNVGVKPDSTGKVSKKVALKAGSSTMVRIRARDFAGLESLDSLKLTRRALDTTKPSIVRISPAKDTTYRYADTSALVTWKVTDAGGLDSVWLDGAGVKPDSTGKVSKKIALKAGSSTMVRIRARDYAGLVRLDSLKLTRPNALIDSTYGIPLNDSVAYGVLHDDRDGQEYRTVVIGGRRWMAENLNYKGNGVDSGKAYANKADSAAKYGRLYSWASALSLIDSCDKLQCASRVAPQRQGLCPKGWHVPSDSEWFDLATTMESFATVGAGNAGIALKSTAGWNPGRYSGWDSRGFRGLPAGGGNSIGGFGDAGRSACWISATEVGATTTSDRYVDSVKTGLMRLSELKRNLHSLRCVEDYAITAVAQDTTLASLIVSKGALTPKFDKNVLTYRDTIVDSFVVVSAYATDSVGSSVWIDGSKRNSATIVPGYNQPKTVHFVVRSNGDGDTLAYTLHVVRRDTVPPKFARIKPLVDTNYAYKDAYAVVSWNVSDAQSGLDTVRIDGIQVKPDAAGRVTDTIALAAGITKKVYLRVRDSAGRVSVDSLKLTRAGAVGDTLGISGLVAYWPFNGDAKDMSGNGNDGVVDGATQVLDRFGKSANAFAFDGINDQIGVPPSSSLNLLASPTDSASFVAWVRTAKGGIANQCVLVKARPRGWWDMPYVIDLTDSGNARMWRYDDMPQSANYLSTHRTINDGAWHQIAFVSAGASKHWLFVDGVADTIDNVEWQNVLSNDDSLIIGAYANYTYSHANFDGAIDDIRIYKRAISAAEVLKLYREGGWTGPQDTTLASLVVSKGTLSPAFGKSQKVYADTVYDSLVRIEAHAADPSVSTVSIDGKTQDTLTVALDPGETKTVIIKVASEDQDFLEYSVTLYRDSTYGIPWNATIAYGVLHDSRDGQEYRTVEIGGRRWMAENLNLRDTGSGGDTVGACYNDMNDSCRKYGRMYRWLEAMAGGASSTKVPSGIRGLCPVGWHVPSDAEWDSLTKAAGGSSVAGDALKSTSGWNSSGSGSDIFGFRAIPAGSLPPLGYRSLVGNALDAGGSTVFWSSTSSGTAMVWRRTVSSAAASMERGDNGDDNWFSIRCLEDYVLPKDTTLASLVVTKGRLSPVFGAAKLEYRDTIIDSIETLRAIAKDTINASVWVDGVKTNSVQVPLEKGTAKVVRVVVRANDGDTLEYRVEVFRSENVIVKSNFATLSSFDAPYRVHLYVDSTVDTTGLRIHYTLDSSSPVATSYPLTNWFGFTLARPVRLIAAPWRQGVRIGPDQVFEWRMDSCIYDFDAPDSGSLYEGDSSALSFKVGQYIFGYANGSTTASWSSSTSSLSTGKSIRSDFSIDGTNYPNTGTGFMTPWNPTASPNGANATDMRGLKAVRVKFRFAPSPTSTGLKKYLRIDFNYDSTIAGVALYNAGARAGIKYGWDVVVGSGVTTTTTVKLLVADAAYPSWATTVPPESIEYQLSIMQGLGFDIGCASSICTDQQGSIEIDDIVYYYK